jgi:hypothetical protein
MRVQPQRTIFYVREQGLLSCLATVNIFQLPTLKNNLGDLGQSYIDCYDNLLTTLNSTNNATFDQKQG